MFENLQVELCEVLWLNLQGRQNNNQSKKVDLIILFLEVDKSTYFALFTCTPRIFCSIKFVMLLKVCDTFSILSVNISPNRLH